MRALHQILIAFVIPAQAGIQPSTHDMLGASKRVAQRSKAATNANIILSEAKDLLAKQ